nr:p18 [Darna trima granulovirus]
MLSTTLNLFTYKPPVETICDDKPDLSEFFIQGILEALHDHNKSKHACFLELKREQNKLFEKLKTDLLDSINGNYYKNHVLLDVLNLYNLYAEEFNDENSAFDTELLNLYSNTATLVFELFSYATNVVVFMKSTADKENALTQLIENLQQSKLITIIKTVELS